MRSITHFQRQLNAQALPLGITGLVLVAGYNWYLWQRDKVLAATMRCEASQLPQLSRSPRVSALVAAWNESSNIDAHIQSFLALSYPNIELILCAGGNDDTLERAQSYASEQVIVLEQKPGEGKQKALAHCLERATGEIMYLTDADCLFDQEALIHLLFPIVEQGEQAATGGSRPLDHQFGQMLPTYIWIADVAASARQPTYIKGMLGRNAAIIYTAINLIGGMNFPAPTGTDYQLAQRLIQVGIAIRYVAESNVPSEYPETISIYRSKQSRWLRNLLIYGLHYTANNDIVATLRTIGTGLAMLLAPLISIITGPWLFVIWLLLLIHSNCAKLRYALFTIQLYKCKLPNRLFVGLLPMSIVDFATWALPAFDMLNVRRRTKW